MKQPKHGMCAVAGTLL